MAGKKATKTGIGNPHAWSRVKRIELRDLANDVGQEAVLLLAKWPTSGEGRAVKAATELVARRLAGGQQIRSLRDAFEDLDASAKQLASLPGNSFFATQLAHKPIRRRGRDRSTMSQLI